MGIQRHATFLMLNSSDTHLGPFPGERDGGGLPHPGRRSRHERSFPFQFTSHAKLDAWLIFGDVVSRVAVGKRRGPAISVVVAHSSLVDVG